MKILSVAELREKLDIKPVDLANIKFVKPKQILETGDIVKFTMGCQYVYISSEDMYKFYKDYCHIDPSPGVKQGFFVYYAHEAYTYRYYRVAVCNDMLENTRDEKLYAIARYRNEHMRDIDIPTVVFRQDFDPCGDGKFEKEYELIWRRRR